MYLCYVSDTHTEMEKHSIGIVCFVYFILVDTCTEKYVRNAVLIKIPIYNNISCVVRGSLGVDEQNLVIILQILLGFITYILCLFTFPH